MICIWPEESWMHIISSFNICKIVKLCFSENNIIYAKNVSEVGMGKFITKSFVKFPLFFLRRQSPAVLIKSRALLNRTYKHTE